MWNHAHNAHKVKLCMYANSHVCRSKHLSEHEYLHFSFLPEYNGMWPDRGTKDLTLVTLIPHILLDMRG